MNLYQKLDAGIFLGSAMLSSYILYGEYNFITMDNSWKFCDKNIPDPICAKIYKEIFYTCIKSLCLWTTGSFCGIKLVRHFYAHIPSSFDHLFGAVIGFSTTNMIFIIGRIYYKKNL